ncbi:MAG: GyrI-like domain-containing protein [Bacteroidia bacterium]|nr:GyrI-like domain-containing protein [Bacteroidia bacterium]
MKEAIEGMAATPATADAKITESEWPATTYFGKRASLEMKDVQPFLDKNLPAIYADLQKNKVEMVAPPSTITWTWFGGNGKCDIAAAFKVADGSKLAKGWEKFEFPASKVLSMDYYGSYEKIESGYLVLEKYSKEKNMTMRVAVEEYITDPIKEPDTTKWLTKIHYLLK